ATAVVRHLGGGTDPHAAHACVAQRKIGRYQQCRPVFPGSFSQRIRPAGQVEVAAEFFCVVNGVFFFVCVDGDFAGFQVDVGGLDRHIALVVVLRGAGRELDVRVQQIQIGRAHV